MKLDAHSPWVVALLALVVVFGGLAALLVTSSTPPGAQGPNYSVLHTRTVGLYPSSVTFDPANGMLYVTNENSNNISVVDAASLHLVTTVSTGLEARSGALDPLNGRLFVANDYTSNISVISTSSNSVLTTIYEPGYFYTLQAEFDASTGQLYVLANGNADLLVINPNTLALSQVIPVDLNPGGAQYAIDPSSHVIYFPARGSLAVEPIQQQTGAALPEIPTPGVYGPTTTFFDPVNGLVYVMLGGMLDDPGNHLVVLDPTTNQFVSNLTVGSWPNIYAYDSARQLLYVVCEASDQVTVINATTNQVTATISFPAGTDPQAIAVDPVTGHLFVAEATTGELVELGLTGNGTSQTDRAILAPGGTSLVSARWTD